MVTAGVSIVFAASALIYVYLNPDDVVVDEEIPSFETPDTTNTDLNDSDMMETPEGTSMLREEDSPVPIPPLEGQFQQGDSSYSIEGRAIVSRQTDMVTLSLADFSVTSGPDLFVYLVETQDTSNEGVKTAVEQGDFINLGELKGNVGNQNYEIPDTIDLDEVVVSIWCRQFGSNFGHVDLQ